MPSQPVLRSGKYRCQVSTGIKNEKGRYIYDSVTADTPKQAFKLALILEDEYKDNRRKPANITLKKAIEAYIEARSNILSASTIRGYEIIKRNRFKDLMKTKVSQINKDVLQKAVNTEAKECSAKTISNAYGLVRSVIAEYTDTDLTVRLPQIITEEKEFLEAPQIMALIEASVGQDCEVPILLAVWLGMRRSEILGLKWESINFKNKTLRVEGALIPDKNNKMILKAETKNNPSRRTLDCPDYILSKLEQMEPEESKRTGLVFSMHPDTLRKHINTLCRSVNIPEVGIHGLRHTNASVMLSLGIADKVAMARGGWSNEKTMKQIYQHIFKDAQKSATDAINSYFDTLVQGENPGDNLGDN